jgi:oligopeptidase B
MRLGDKTFEDDYFWLRNKGSPEVVRYLEAENAYTDAKTERLKPLVEKLYAEGLARLQENDTTAPVPFRGWLYYDRTREADQYPVHCRKRDGVKDAPEVVLLDPNEIGKSEAFVDVGERETSDDGNLYAYTIDTTGFREYTLHVKDLRSGSVLPEQIPRVVDVAFSADGKMLFYTTEDATTHRADKVHRHQVGDLPSKDALVYEEKDERFDVLLRRSRSLDYVVLSSESKTTTEARLLDARRPLAAPKLVEPRRSGVEYYVEPGKSDLTIRVNDTGPNFRLVKTPLSRTDHANWKELVPQRPDVMIEDAELFSDHVVVRERKDAKATWRSIDSATGGSRTMAIDEPVYQLGFQWNAEFTSATFRYQYSSPTTPWSVYAENVHDGTRTLLKRVAVPTFDPQRYVSERLSATARDGTTVPVSIVHARDVTADGTHPLLLYGYGAYGLATDLAFDPMRVSLLDHGVVFAVAHIRGGGDQGKAWYEAGRMKSKMNTFTDFIDCAEWLSKAGWAKPGDIGIEGRSAGGLLMGAVTNMRPDLWRVVLAAVPFVDVVNTMSDASLPLTTGEYDEWGNPQIPEQLSWLLAYSPYDNVARKNYPVMLVETAYNDSQVMYWEPAKWVARLRATKTDSNLLLLKTNMKPAGHGGSAGRYEKMRERAFDDAFLLTELGADRPPSSPSSP